MHKTNELQKALKARAEANDSWAWIRDNDKVFSKGKIIRAIANNGDILPKRFALQNENTAIVEIVSELDEAKRYLVKDLLEFDRSHDLGASLMSNISCLNEAAILNTIRIRYALGHVYTNIEPLIIAINPFKDMSHIYKREYYDSLPGDDKCAHIFHVATNALREVHNQNQSLVVSGESGAGKTESCKIIIRHLTSLPTSTNSSTTASPPSRQHSASLETKILACSPILEAFGNACTLRNDNSSRFGKYLRIMFDSAAEVRGADMIHYLLEKSRIISQIDGERSYHVFYQIMRGMNVEEKANLRLNWPVPGSEGDDSCVGFEDLEFRYLSMSTDGNESEIQQDELNYQALKLAMSQIGFGEDLQDQIMRIAATVLHLGQIEFSVPAHNDRGSCVADKTENSFCFACEVLGMPGLDQLLIKKNSKTSARRTSVICVEYSTVQARANADALAKDLYDKLFSWLVMKCNETLKPKNYLHYVGILDIFGFELFDINSLEQLCINYCNEKLQMVFNNVILSEEIKLMQKEGIESSHLQFEHNTDCVLLIESPENGIFKLLDEQCALKRECKDPSEQPLAYLKKVNATHLEKNPRLVPMAKTRQAIRPAAFTILHFAGPVEYDAMLFLVKNNDRIDPEVENMLLTSTNAFIRELYTGGPTPTNPSARGSVAYQTQPTSIIPGRKFGKALDSSLLSSTAGAGGAVTRSLGTIAAKFRSNLQDLVKELESTNIQFLRCLKPNHEKLPGVFDSKLVFDQLRYSGIMSVVNVRKNGYPLRKTWTEIHEIALQMNLYRGTGINGHNVLVGREKDVAVRLLKLALCDGGWFEGKTKVFMKHETFMKLRTFQLSLCVIMVQNKWISLIQRRKYLKMKDAVIVIKKTMMRWLHCARYRRTLRFIILIQSIARKRSATRIVHKERLLCRNLFFLHRWRYLIRLRKRCAAKLLFSFLRGRRYRFHMQVIMKAARKLQSLVRMKASFKRFILIKKLAGAVNKNWRKFIAIKKYKQLLKTHYLVIWRSDVSKVCSRLYSCYRNNILSKFRSRLFGAAVWGDISELESLIEEGGGSFVLSTSASLVVDLRDRYSSFSTAILQASDGGHVEFIHRLVENDVWRSHGGNDPLLAADGIGRTALHRAVVTGAVNMGLIEYLLRNVPDLSEYVNLEGQTALDVVKELMVVKPDCKQIYLPVLKRLQEHATSHHTRKIRQQLVSNAKQLAASEHAKAMQILPLNSVLRRKHFYMDDAGNYVPDSNYHSMCQDSQATDPDDLVISREAQHLSLTISSLPDLHDWTYYQLPASANAFDLQLAQEDDPAARRALRHAKVLKQREEVQWDAASKPKPAVVQSASVNSNTSKATVAVDAVQLLMHGKCAPLPSHLLKGNGLPATRPATTSSPLPSSSVKPATALTIKSTPPSSTLTQPVLTKQLAKSFRMQQAMPVSGRLISAPGCAWPPPHLQTQNRTFSEKLLGRDKLTSIR